MPTRITTKDQNTYEAEYTYDGQGRKLRATYQKKVMDIVAPARPLTKTLAMSSRFEGLVNSRVRPETIIQDTIIHGAPIGDYSEFSQTDYCGNIIYRGNRATVLNAHGYTNIDTDAATGESTATHYYYLKDHLGNNRVVFRDDGLVVQENHYYAYGNLTADCYGSDTQQYKYNGKELDRKLGIDLYDYGARWYDPVGSSAFTTIDPLCEEDYDVSPYVYCHNNPINRTDPDGNTDYELMANGLIKHREFDNNTNDRLFVHNSQQFISLRKGLLCQLLQQIDNILGHYATTNYVDDAFKLFKFAADNSTVEWGLEKFSTKGKAYYSIHTSNNTSSLTTNYTNEEIANLQLILHSHPKYNGNDMASGDYEAYAKASGSMNSVYYPTSDLMTLNNIYNRFQKIHGTGYPVSKYPKAYIYNSKSSLLFKYTTEQSILNPIKITNYLQILRLVK